MKNSNTQNTQNGPQINVRYVENKDLLVIKDESGRTILVSANLVRHALGIPYQKKDGTMVTKKQIEASQAKARKAYARAIETNSFKKAK